MYLACTVSSVSNVFFTKKKKYVCMCIKSGKSKGYCLQEAWWEFKKSNFGAPYGVYGVACRNYRFDSTSTNRI